MNETIDVGLTPIKPPFSWMMRGGGVLYTAHGPVRPDGSIDTGPIAQQARLTFDNLLRAVQSAGKTMDDVMQVLIYMSDVADMPAIDAVYCDYFRPPWPNRSSAGVALVVPGMRIEVVAYVSA